MCTKQSEYTFLSSKIQWQEDSHIVMTASREIIRILE